MSNWPNNEKCRTLKPHIWILDIMLYSTFPHLVRCLAGGARLELPSRHFEIYTTHTHTHFLQCNLDSVNKHNTTYWHNRSFFIHVIVIYFLIYLFWKLLIYMNQSIIYDSTTYYIIHMNCFISCWKIVMPQCSSYELICIVNYEFILVVYYIILPGFLTIGL